MPNTQWVPSELGPAAEDQDVELPGLADEAAFVIGLRDRADPEPVGAVMSRTDLAVGCPSLRVRIQASRYLGGQRRRVPHAWVLSSTGRRQCTLPPLPGKFPEIFLFEETQASCSTVTGQAPCIGQIPDPAGAALQPACGPAHLD